MNNPYQAVLDKATLRESLVATSQLSPDQLEQFGSNVTDDDFVHIQEWAFGKIQGFDVQATLYIGGLLTLVRSAAYLDSRVERFHQTMEELDISKTKAYDSMAIFRCFGKSLLDEETLMRRFPLESLKLLSVNSVSEETRIEAVRLAVTGTRVTIKRAKQLLGILEHDEVTEYDSMAEEVEVDAVAELVPPVVEVAAKSTSKNTAKPMPRKIWSFKTDGEVRLVIELAPHGIEDNVSILDVLEAAIQQYELEANQSNPQLETTSSTQE